MRVVLPGDTGPLPTEHAFGLHVEPAGRVADVGRLVIAPGFMGDSGSLLLALLSQAWLVMRTQGISDACSVLTRAMARFYQRACLRVVPLGEAKAYCGEARFPALVPAESFARLCEKLARVFE